VPSKEYENVKFFYSSNINSELNAITFVGTTCSVEGGFEGESYYNDAPLFVLSGIERRSQLHTEVVT